MVTLATLGTRGCHKNCYARREFRVTGISRSSLRVPSAPLAPGGSQVRITSSAIVCELGRRISARVLQLAYMRPNLFCEGVRRQVDNGRAPQPLQSKNGSAENFHAR